MRCLVWTKSGELTYHICHSWTYNPKHYISILYYGVRERLPKWFPKLPTTCHSISTTEYLYKIHLCESTCTWQCHLLRLEAGNKHTHTEGGRDGRWGWIFQREKDPHPKHLERGTNNQLGNKRCRMADESSVETDWIKKQDKEEKIGWERKRARERGTQLGRSCVCGASNKQRVEEVHWFSETSQCSCWQDKHWIIIPALMDSPTKSDRLISAGEYILEEGKKAKNKALRYSMAQSQYTPLPRPLSP